MKAFKFQSGRAIHYEYTLSTADLRITESRNMVFVAGYRFGRQVAFNLWTVANKPMLTFFAIVNMVEFIIE
jgi:hypothetical protein